MKRFLSFLLILCSFSALSQMKEAVYGDNRALLRMPTDQSLAVNGKYPVVLYWPGIGETANDGSISIAYRQGLSQQIKLGARYPFIVIAMFPKSDWASTTTVHNVLLDAFNKLPIDTSRVYGVGISAGGKVMLNYVNAYVNPLVKAMWILSPASPGGLNENFRKVPTVIVHATNDKVCSYTPIKNAVVKAQAVGIPVELKTVKSSAGKGHGNWRYYLTDLLAPAGLGVSNRLGTTFRRHFSLD